MAIRDLLKRYPKQFVVQMKIWTPKRSTIEAEDMHDETIGMLLVHLTARDEPRNDAEREAMQNLLKVLKEGSDP